MNAIAVMLHVALLIVPVGALVIHGKTTMGVHAKGAPKHQQQQREDDFKAVHARVRPYTMITEEKLQMLYNAVQQVNAAGVEGDFVEAGVWKGGASMTMAYAQLTATPAPQRSLWLYDTYEGMPKPNSTKDDAKSKEEYQKVQEGKAKEDYVEEGKWCYGSEEQVRANMLATGYPKEHLRFVKGKVEDTLKVDDNIPAKIAILRLDTDWYESTKMELHRMWPRLQPGGLLIMDDYCAWGGSRTAADEFLPDSGVQLKGTESESLCAYAWKSARTSG